MESQQSPINSSQGMIDLSYLDQLQDKINGEIVNNILSKFYLQNHTFVISRLAKINEIFFLVINLNYIKSYSKSLKIDNIKSEIASTCTIQHKSILYPSSSIVLVLTSELPQLLTHAEFME